MVDAAGGVAAIVPLPADVDELAACPAPAGEVLVLRTAASSSLTILDPRASRTRTVAAGGRSAVCGAGGGTIALLRDGLGGRTIARFAFPSMVPIGESPAAVDVRRSAPGPAGGVYVLAGSGGTSEVALVPARNSGLEPAASISKP